MRRFEEEALVEVSVIVPVYKGMRWVARCLKSLSTQTLNPAFYEIILVFNGPDDGAIEYSRQFALLNSEINIRIIDSIASTAAQARNTGLEYATKTHVTWVDVDDLVSPNFLMALVMSAEPAVIPVAQIANVDERGHVDRKNAINLDLLAQTEYLVPPQKFPRATTFMTAKLITREWAQENLLLEDLKSGEDVAFYGNLLSKYSFKLSVMPGFAGATYYRQLVANSVSRGRRDRDFMVKERAMVIKSLDDALKHCATDNQNVILGYINSQLGFIQTYIKENPSELTEILDYLSSLRIENLPWTRLQGPVEDLAICYNFVPYADTGANVAAKRIREAGRPTDVISNNMSKVRETQKENRLLALPYLANHAELSSPVTFANDTAIADFVTRGLAQYKDNVRSGRTYKRIYSRSMWPASHFLAAAIRLQEPSIEWTAEFSDPVSLTTEGTIRTAPLNIRTMSGAVFGVGAIQTHPELASSEDVYRWTEVLPYIYADRIIFTNEHQLETMLSLAPPEFGGQIRAKSQVAHHPTLPRLFYEIGTPTKYSSSSRVNIGYFGEFYTSRGLIEILDALSMLEPNERSAIALHIYTASPLPERYKSFEDELVFTHPKLSYFDFLSALNTFDCLIVNDASTLDFHERNPYLPSKYSDYRGSDTPIWSVVEPGSVLSGLPSEFKSTLGSANEALLVLRSLLQFQ